MTRRLRLMFVPGFLALVAPSIAFAQTGGADVALKKRAVQEVDAQSGTLIDLSDQVWRFAETALKETESSKVLADYAEQQGFRVTRGVAGLPTSFVAEYGQGSPVIGIMGEYDALPGISQKAQPSPHPACDETHTENRGRSRGIRTVSTSAPSSAWKRYLTNGSTALARRSTHVSRVIRPRARISRASACDSPRTPSRSSHPW